MTYETISDADAVGVFTRGGFASRSEGSTVSSPVREGGTLHLFFSEARRADINSGAPTALNLPNTAFTPPSRTVLLSVGPSDLDPARN